MGIYLPNMEMPQKGQMLVISPGGTSYVCFNGIGELLTQTTAFPIPPHGDLIDRDALLAYENQHYEYRSDSFYVETRTIELAPTIIPAEEGE